MIDSEHARTYDFLLSGAHNFAVDRLVAEQAEKLMPGTAKIARIHRAFLGRALRYLLGNGIRQFLDIGSGLWHPGGPGDIADNHELNTHVYGGVGKKQAVS